MGSGTFAATPKYSPCRDRRYQSEPENRKVKLVDTETQTDAMDVSETDISPSVCYPPSRDISMALDHCPQLTNTSIATITTNTTSQPIDVPQMRQQLPESQTIHAQAYQLMEQRLQNQMQYSTSPITITPTSPNGNSLTTSDLTFQDACSSPDQLLDDVMNSNERLDITDCCSDNENLERLGRKVIELINENRLSMHSTTITTSTNNSNSNSNSITNAPSNNQNQHQQQICANVATIVNNTNATTITAENGNSECVTGRDTTDDTIEIRTPRLSRCSSLHRNSMRQQCSDMGNALNANHSGESNEDICEDSWSDEEGEDTDYNNYPLRRRRYY